MITITIYKDGDDMRFAVHEHAEDGTPEEATDRYEVLDCPCEDGNDGWFIRRKGVEEVT